MKCPECKGVGSFQIEVDDYADCEECKGRGIVKGPNDEVVSHSIEFNLSDLREQAVDRAVTRLLTDRHGSLRSFIDSEVRKAVVPEITKGIAEIVRETMESEFQPTDSFGHARGEKTSLRAMIVEQARVFMNTAPDRNRFNQRRGENPRTLQELIQEQVAAHWKKELEPEANKAVAELKRALKARLTDKIDAAVAALLKDPARG